MLLQIKNKFSIILLLLFTQIVSSQEYPSKNISSLDGLPSNEIFSIFKDSRGILWVGTGNGLSKISNGEIKNYYKSNGLAHNKCYSIIEDKNNNMWFASYGGGLTFYDGKKFKIINNDSGLVNDDIRKIINYDNLIFVGTRDGLSIININNKKIKNFRPNPKFESFQIMDFFEFKSEIYFITFRDGIWKFDFKKNKIIQILNHPNQHFKTLKLNNNQFLYTMDGNWRFHGGINKIEIEDYLKGNEPISKTGNTVFFDLIEIDKENIFTGGVSVNFPNGGLFLYNTKNNKLSNEGKKYGVLSKDVWTFFLDKNRNLLYVGTLDSGLYIIDLKKTVSFHESKLVYNSESTILNYLIYDNKRVILFEDEVHIKSNNKLIKYSTKKFITDIEFYKKSIDKLIKYQSYQNAEEIKFKSIKLYNSKIWINTTIGLFSLNSEGKFDKHYPILVGEFDFINNNDLIFQYPHKGVQIIKNEIEIEYFDILKKNNPKDVFKILKNDNNHYFVSLYKGLYTFQNHHFYSFYENNIWKEKEFKHAILDTKKRLVLSNTFGDIFILKDSKEFKIEKKIHNSEYIGKSIQFLDSYNDYLIIGTEKGINLYKDGSVILINEDNGIKQICKNGKVINDILFVTTNKGIYEINLKTLLSRKNQLHKISISSLEVNYNNFFHNKFSFGILKENQITLPYYQNIINIKYGLIDHPQTKKLLYSFLVKGLENSNWSQWNSNSTINLPYLPSGKFEILVKIKDLEFGKNHEYKLLGIEITPPFWKTWWFITISIFALGLIVYLIYKRRISELKEKNRIQKRLVETKMEALQSQMNPHFIFNAMNSIQNFIIDNNTDEALMYMGEFSKIIRQTLNNSSLQKISLYEDLQYIQSYITIENMRYKHKVDVKINIDDQIDLMEIEIPPMLIQPFIENVFVHAFNNTVTNPKLELNYKLVDEILIIEVIDNGKGINNNNLSRLNNSKGIKLTKERLSLLNPKFNNSVEIESTPDNGTSVRIKLNINVNLQNHHDN